MESWDDDNFEPIDVAHTGPGMNKWEGEDEEENVRESWEDEEEEQKEQKEREQQKPVEMEEAKPKLKKKSLADKIAEKEKQKREEQEKRAKEQLEEEISAEEKLKRQKESDLSIALETTFGDHKSNHTELDHLNPTTKEEFDEFTEALTKKLHPLTKHAEYPAFAENVVRNICASMNSFDIKKIKTTIDNLYLEKQKIEKGDKIKKNKGKAKAKIKVEDENQFSAYVDSYDDYDDFM